MKTLRGSLLRTITVLILLAGCGPRDLPAAGAPPDGQPPADPLPGEPTPTLEPINLAGPEMAVGSTWLYVDGSTLVAVPPGKFIMGREGGVDNPQREVELSEFWMYRTKVTNGQYAYCVSQGGCSAPSHSDNPGFVDPYKVAEPVTGVTWEQADAYCEFVHARLPTEAEWEKAARGPDGSIYPWGDEAPSCALLNYDNCIGQPSNVTLYPQGQSYFKALDMSGNAFEWIADNYQDDYYLVAPLVDPPGPEFGIQKVVRSTGFDSGGSQAPSFSRFFNRPENHRDNLGFRCVVDEPVYYSPFCTYPAVYGTDGVGGPASGEEIQVNCPDLSINQVLGCEGTQPSTSVTLNGPAGSIVSVPEPACTSLSGPGSTTCTDHGQLKICSECTITKTSDPQCPAGYTYDPGSGACLGQPAPGVCLPGFVPGARPEAEGESPPADVQCCVLQEANGAPVDVFPFCPAGTFYDGADCISVEVVSPYCKVEGVALNSCQPGGGEGCPAQSCPYPKIWDSNLCTCTYPSNW